MKLSIEMRNRADSRTVEMVKDALERRAIIEADRLTAVAIVVEIEEISREFYTSGAFTFRNAVNEFKKRLINSEESVLIIDDDDALHLRCTRLNEECNCELWFGGQIIGKERILSSALAEMIDRIEIELKKEMGRFSSST
jgi:hypothetical protein